MDAQTTVTIVIDGREVEAQPGSMVIEAADAANIYIPRFCYHPKLSIAANCRMCLVEVEKAPKPLPACATPVSEGMIVQTRSATAVEAQQGTMEFLLINHPLDCPVCDQGGECPLQDQAMGYGQDSSRYEEEKRVKAPLDLGPLVATAMTRCIHCTRCVRFGREIAGTMELGATGRGEDMTIETYLDGSVDSEVSGNIIDLCPVGALTSKPYRFTARPWELFSHEGISPHDSLGTNITLQTAHQAVKRVVPRNNEAINECWISDRDRFAYEGAECDDRLTQPMIRRKEGLVETSWEEALTETAAAMREAAGHDGSQLAALIHPMSSMEESFLLQKIMRGLGSDQIDHRLLQRDFSDDAFAPAYPGLEVALSDIESLKGILLVGCNPRKEAPLLALRIRKMVEQGGVVGMLGSHVPDLNFSVCASRAVKPVDLPSAFGALAGGVGVSDFAAVAASGHYGDPQVPEPDGLLGVLSQAGGDGMILLGQGALNHPAAGILRTIAGRLAEQTGMQLGVLSPANSAGAWWAGAVPHRTAQGKPAKTAGANASQMADLTVHTALLYGLEPSIDHSDPVRLEGMLDRAQRVVSFSAFRSAVSDQADIVLPIAPYTEFSGRYLNCSGVVQSANAALAPRGNSRPGWKVLRVLGNFLSLADFDYDDLDQVGAELSRPPAVSMRSADGAGTVPVPAVDGSDAATAGDLFTLVAERSIYQADPIVRRSNALARTRDGSAEAFCRFHPEDLEAAGLAGVSQAQLVGQHHQATLQVTVDRGVVRGSVLVFVGSSTTAGFGSDSVVSVRPVT